MRKLLPLLLLLFCARPASATWTLTQVKDTTGCVTPCSVTVTSTGAGHLLVAGLIGSLTSMTITSVTAGACNVAWVHAPNSAGSNTGDGSVDLFYCTNSVAGQTAIAITMTAGGSNVGVIWEASSSLGSIAIDSGAVPSQNHIDTTCTNCAGTALTLSGNNNFVAVLAACGGTCSGLAGAGFTNDLLNPSGDGVGHGITSGSLTAPTTWTMTSGTQVNDAAAFQEASGGAAATGENRRQRMERLEE